MQNIKDQLNTIVKQFNNGEKQIALNKISLLLQTNKNNIELLLPVSYTHLTLPTILRV